MIVVAHHHLKLSEGGKKVKIKIMVVGECERQIINQKKSERSEEKTTLTQAEGDQKV